jgi:hypothetical protein
MRESHRIPQESTGTHWNVEAVFRPEIVRIFSGGFLPVSCAFRQEPAGILLPQNHRKYPEATVSGLDRSTWVLENKLTYIIIIVQRE